jgi:hypothetical protein
LRLKLTTGGKRTLAPYPRRSHLTHFPYFVQPTNHSFAVSPPFFFLNSLGSLPFVSSTVKCRMIHRKKLNTHTTFRSEAGYICIPSAALRESGTKAQVTTGFFATRRPDHRRDIFLIPSDLIRMMKIRCYSTSLFVALWKRNPLECFERHQVSEEVAVYRVFGCGSIEDVTRRQRIPVS